MIITIYFLKKIKITKHLKKTYAHSFIKYHYIINQVKFYTFKTQ